MSHPMLSSRHFPGRRSLFALVIAVASCGFGSLAGDYQADVTGALMTGASLQKTTRNEPATVTQVGNELTIVYGPCQLAVTKTNMALSLKPGQSCTHNLMKHTLTSGEGDIKGREIRLALVWSKEGAGATITERVIFTPKSGCK